MVSRRSFSTLLLVVAFCSIAACSNHTNGTTNTASTTALPLTSLALAIGGDVRDAATTEVEVSLSPKQLRDIEIACRDAGGIPLSADATCARILMLVVRPGTSPEPCHEPDICMTVLDTTRLDFAAAAVVEIVDSRSEGSHCSSVVDPCLRIGLDVRRDESLSSRRLLRPSTSRQPGIADQPVLTASSATELEQTSPRNNLNTPATSPTSRSLRRDASPVMND